MRVGALAHALLPVAARQLFGVELAEDFARGFASGLSHLEVEEGREERRKSL